MPIREKGYYNWDGELKVSPVKWLPMFRIGAKTVFKKIWTKIMMLIALIPFAVFLVGVFVATKPELKMFADAVEQIKNDAALMSGYYTNGFLIFWMVIIGLFVGSDAIAADIKFKSVTLYLSRPISRLDYVLGKYSVLLFYLLSVTLVPGMLLIFFKILFSASFSVPINVIAASIFFPIVVSLFLTSLCIMFSSMSSSGRFVKIMIFLAYPLSAAIGESFYGIFKKKIFFLISIYRNISQFAEFLFGTYSGEGFYMMGFLSGCILLGLSALFFWLVLMRVKRMEV